MSHLEPPTVTTRPPPAATPDLPVSPPPSRQDLRTPPPEGREPSQDSGKEGAICREARDRGECSASPERDNEGRLRRTRTNTGLPRWRRLLEEWKLYLTLENSGSVARDHLASERTFLAYARTSLTIASTGVALVQLFTLSAETDLHMQRFARPLGAVMIALGMVTLGVGVMRYFLIQDALIRGVYPVARISTGMLSFVLVVVIIVVFIVILAAR